MSVCSFMSLFVCIGSVHQQYLLIRTSRKYLMTVLSTRPVTLYSLGRSCCLHMPLIPSVSKVQSPPRLCLRSGPVGGPLTCRHGAFHCQCLTISRPSEEPRRPRDAHCTAEKTLHAVVMKQHIAEWDDWGDVVGNPQNVNIAWRSTSRHASWQYGKFLFYYKQNKI